MEWRRSEGVEWLRAELPGAVAAFSTRGGGVSAGPYAALNLGLHTDDDREAVLENRRRLATALGHDPARVACGHQVHGAALAEAGARPHRDFLDRAGPALAEVDGQVVVRAAGDAGLVYVADCLPVALAGPGGAAILHCGWRGLAAGILARGVEAIAATDAAIGPGIGPCCYEVGADVLSAFGGLGDGIAAGRKLNLPEVATRLLLDAGVERIESAGACTSCEPARFFSHRRDRGVTGRQAGLVWRERGGA